MLRHLNDLMNIMNVITEPNKSHIFNDIISKTSAYVEQFTNQYLQITPTKILLIENDLSKVIYNRKSGMKEKIFGYIELINDFSFYLNKQKYQKILRICDDINQNIHHFMLLLNDTSYRTN